jgi:hypothetical protein
MSKINQKIVGISQFYESILDTQIDLAIESRNKYYDESQYSQQYKCIDISKNEQQNNFRKYRHKNTGKIVEAEFAKAYHGEWLFWVKNPVEKEHKTMSSEFFNKEYEVYEK